MPLCWLDAHWLATSWSAQDMHGVSIATSMAEGSPGVTHVARFCGSPRGSLYASCKREASGADCS